MTAIADEKYVRLTTFTKDGRRKETPVWIADLGDGTIGFTTGVDSWKAKRIRNTPGVELAPSTMKGAVAEGAPTTAANARIVTGVAVDPVSAAIKAKYRLMAPVMTLTGKLARLVGRGEDTCGVVITVE